MVQPDPEEQEEEMGMEPGVDIIAQPPGKRLKNLTMLSGGGKNPDRVGLAVCQFSDEAVAVLYFGTRSMPHWMNRTWSGSLDSCLS